MAKDESYFRPHSRLDSKEKKEKRWEDEHCKLYVVADAHVGWKKVKCMGLYSTDLPFTQHKHDKYSVKTNGQKLADKEVCERHVKLQADRRQICGGARNIMISIG